MAALQAFLGHNSISTVMIYVKIAQEHGKTLYKSAVDNMALKTSVKLFPDNSHQRTKQTRDVAELKMREASDSSFNSECRPKIADIYEARI